MVIIQVVYFQTSFCVIVEVELIWYFFFYADKDEKTFKSHSSMHQNFFSLGALDYKEKKTLIK